MSLGKRIALVAGIVVLAIVISLSAIYNHYAGLVDSRLARPVFNNVAQIYGTPGPDGRPRLITGLANTSDRSKRRILQPNQIPPLLRDAIISVEDRRFFEHNGINWVRLGEGLLTPIFKHARMQGGSTLTMQMARSFFLTNQRTASRKLAEMMIATELERRFTKEQILALYVNQVDLGQRGSFDIRGFGEGARAYFGKDVNRLNLPETAFLAGLVNGPSYFSPTRHPDRAVHRRNIVLQAMVSNGKIDQTTADAAKAYPLKLAAPETESDEAPYFADLVREQLLNDFGEQDLDSGGLRIYTGLDPDLQRVASHAVAAGMTRLTKVSRHGVPQIALVALNPHTGDVLALIGGRNYGESQLDRVVQKRPTGSIFKPFVYATAIASRQYTQISEVDSAAGQFASPDGTTYSPRNFDSAETAGPITLRAALAHSVNTATVRLAEQLGYDKVCQLAANAGIPDLKPTPSVAIGSYDATPLDMAGAFTIFANGGTYVQPHLFQQVKDSDNQVRSTVNPDSHSVVDSRVAFVLTDMMQDVLVEGTATNNVAPDLKTVAAGKTGTSHDAWFAGYTGNLLCIVWVGYDDYTNLDLEGAKAAAPIWSDFLEGARHLQSYRRMQPFSQPKGVVQLAIDRQSNLPATDKCSTDTYQAWFLEDAIPKGTCDNPNSDGRNFFQHLFGIGKKDVIPTDTPGPPPPPKKKGFWKRMFGR